jgi:hypothetical protein
VFRTVIHTAAVWAALLTILDCAVCMCGKARDEDRMVWGAGGATHKAFN